MKIYKITYKVNGGTPRRDYFPTKREAQEVIPYLRMYARGVSLKTMDIKANREGVAKVLNHENLFTKKFIKK